MMRTTGRLRGFVRRSFGLLLGTLLVTTPAVVLASHQFPDVPTAHPFHNEISAIAKAGITTGFSDGGYHPSEPVTRQAMAAFMQRGFGRAGLVTRTLPITTEIRVGQGSSSTDSVLVRQLTVTVPGASSSNILPSQLVHLTGRVTLSAGMGAEAGCPCTFSAGLVDRGGAGFVVVADQPQTFVSPEYTGGYWSFEVEGLTAAPPGARTFELWVRLQSRTTTNNMFNFPISSYSSLSAQTFPFGPTGGNTP